MTVNVHELHLDQALGFVIASCSCGWIDDDFDDLEAAKEGWEDHCDAAFYEATMRSEAW